MRNLEERLVPCARWTRQKNVHYREALKSRPLQRRWLPRAAGQFDFFSDGERQLVFEGVADNL